MATPVKEQRDAIAKLTKALNNANKFYEQNGALLQEAMKLASKAGIRSDQNIAQAQSMLRQIVMYIERGINDVKRI